MIPRTPLCKAVDEIETVVTSNLRDVVFLTVEIQGYVLFMLLI
jgi:hypothetical protein